MRKEILLAIAATSVGLTGCWLREPVTSNPNDSDRINLVVDEINNLRDEIEELSGREIPAVEIPKIESVTTTKGEALSNVIGSVGKVIPWPWGTLIVTVAVVLGAASRKKPDEKK